MSCSLLSPLTPCPHQSRLSISLTASSLLRCDRLAWTSVLCLPVCRYSIRPPRVLESIAGGGCLHLSPASQSGQWRNSAKKEIVLGSPQPTPLTISSLIYSGLSSVVTAIHDPRGTPTDYLDRLYTPDSSSAGPAATRCTAVARSASASTVASSRPRADKPHQDKDAARCSSYSLYHLGDNLSWVSCRYRTLRHWRRRCCWGTLAVPISCVLRISRALPQ